MTVDNNYQLPTTIILLLLAQQVVIVEKGSPRCCLSLTIKTTIRA
jgi:hypothetical protein